MQLECIHAHTIFSLVLYAYIKQSSKFAKSKQMKIKSDKRMEWVGTTTSLKQCQIVLFKTSILSGLLTWACYKPALLKLTIVY